MSSECPQYSQHRIKLGQYPGISDVTICAGKSSTRVLSVPLTGPFYVGVCASA
jgi:hypothetical protein